MPVYYNQEARICPHMPESYDFENIYSSFWSKGVSLWTWMSWADMKGGSNLIWVYLFLYLMFECLKLKFFISYIQLKYKLISLIKAR